jgi:hypothetical protein
VASGPWSRRFCSSRSSTRSRADVLDREPLVVALRGSPEPDVDPDRAGGEPVDRLRVLLRERRIARGEREHDGLVRGLRLLGLSAGLVGAGARARRGDDDERGGGHGADCPPGHHRLPGSAQLTWCAPDPSAFITKNAQRGVEG